LQLQVSESGTTNSEKIKTDRYFYEELNGARQAAYAYGYDGAQWIMDNFGINLEAFQSAAMQWMQIQNKEMKNGSYEQVQLYADHRSAKQEEYAAKFAAEQGGDISDDVAF